MRSSHLALIVALLLVPLGIANENEESGEEEELGADLDPTVRCVASSSTPLQTITLTNPSNDSVAPLFGDDILVGGSPNSAREPSVFISSHDGAIFIAGPQCLWVSEDDGASFVRRSVKPPSGPAVGGQDSDMAMDDSGNIYYSDLFTGLAGETAVGWTTDNGQNWSSDQTVQPVNLSKPDRQWVALSGSNVWLAVKTHFASTPIKSGDATLLLYNATVGVTPSFSVRHWNVTGTAHVSGQSGKIQAPSNGTTLYIPFIRDIGSGERIELAVSYDSGATFHLEPMSGTLSDTTRIFVVSALDDAENLVLVWMETENNTLSTESTDVYYAMRSSTGQVSGPFQVNPESIENALLPNVAAGGDGKIGIAYYGTDRQGFSRDLPADTEWFLYYSIINNGASGNITSTVRARSDPVRLGGLCSNGTSCPEDLNRTAGEFLGVARLPDHRAVISYNYKTNNTDSIADLRFIQQINGTRLI